MTIKIKLLHPNARMPEYKTAGASGMDLYSVETVRIDPGYTRILATEVAIELPPGYEAQIRPRSSWSISGILCHFGTIDIDYRGALSVILTNTNDVSFQVHVGDRIAQLVIAPVARVEVVQVDELSETARGAGAFGSTGR